MSQITDSAVASDTSPSMRRAEFAATYPLFAATGLVAAWLIGPLAAFRGIQLAITSDNLGSDSYAYWLTRDGLPYVNPPGSYGGYLYSPAFAQALRPVTWLPWEAFVAAWIVVQVAALVWLLSPLSLRWALPLAGLAVPEIVNGNVHVLFAVVAAVGFRHAGAWALPVLTKVTPGVGLLWFAFRGEWRRLAAGVAVMVAVALVSFAVAPDAWARWVEFLVDHRGGGWEPTWLPPVRWLLAVGLLWWGARRGRPWVLPVVLVLAVPMLFPTTFAVLLALVRLVGVRVAPVGRSARDGRRPTYSDEVLSDAPNACYRLA